MRNDLNFAKTKGSISSRITILAIMKPTHLYNRDNQVSTTLYSWRDTFLKNQRANLMSNAIIISRLSKLSKELSFEPSL